MKYLSDKDVLAGLMFLAIGLLGLGLSVRFEFGSTAHPGPGFFPIVLSALLTAIGAGVTILGMAHAIVPAPHLVWRPFLLITLAVILFAISVERFGLMPSVFVTALTASFAKPGYGVVARLAVSAILALASAGLFIGLLRLPIALWSF